MLLTSSLFPASTRGRIGASTPKIAISENGQVRFNTFATNKLLEGSKSGAKDVSMVYADYDEATRKISFSLSPVSFKAKAEDGLNAKITGKSNQLAFTASGICNHLGYDFKASGNQTFALESVGKTGHVFGFTFPNGTLENKTVKRGPRKAKADKTPSTPEVKTPVTEDVE